MSRAAVLEPLTDFDLHLLTEGTHHRSFDKLGAHVGEVDGIAGVRFAVWAPNARQVDVIGTFNGWRAGATPLRHRSEAGVWEAFVPGVVPGASYKYRIESTVDGYVADRADPYGFGAELRPETGSRVVDAPMSIYEVHLGSWRRDPCRGRPHARLPRARGRARRVRGDMGFTHVELLPVMEHPFYGSWGYQGTGYFAPTARFGSPEDFMRDGRRPARRRRRRAPRLGPGALPQRRARAWRTSTARTCTSTPIRARASTPTGAELIFNYGRYEVRSRSSSRQRAGLARALPRRRPAGGRRRVDAVPRLLAQARRLGAQHLRRPREPRRRVGLLRELNEALVRRAPGSQSIAEESTAWPMVSRPTWVGGLGFGLKWNMGWMHDTLAYVSREPGPPRLPPPRLTFRLLYAFGGELRAALSHDEVVHGKGRCSSKMPGDDWQRSPTCGCSTAIMWGHPGKKLHVHGLRVRPGARVEPRRLARLAPAPTPAPPACSTGCATSTTSTATTPALHEARRRSGRLRVGGLQ
jgi:1,4-alpha-glucan branching enzyme